MNYSDSFNYLDSKNIYLDSACQSLRPICVIGSINDYYQKYNSCGGRVRFEWGRIVDEKVANTRKKILNFLKLKPRDYNVSFTLNTTYGLNLILNQLNLGKISQVVTSDIEHNSVFLSTMSFAKKHQIKRIVLSRNSDGSINPDQIPENSLLVVNCVSNVDGRKLTNLKEITKNVHKKQGIIIIDAAQAMAHNSDLLHKTNADAICFSSHKMYGPSLGVIIFKNELISQIDASFIGGGMVDDVNLDSFILSNSSRDHFYSIFEPGLQAWGEIMALGSVIDWLENIPKSFKQDLDSYSQQLFTFLSKHPKIHLINQIASPTLSFYVEGINSHLLGDSLAEEGIMTRTGYFCVHYYLDHVLKVPPLIRFSLGYHTKQSDIDTVINILSHLK